MLFSMAAKRLDIAKVSLCSGEPANYQAEAILIRGLCRDDSLKRQRHYFFRVVLLHKAHGLRVLACLHRKHPTGAFRQHLGLH